jgi:DamX protein
LKWTLALIVSGAIAVAIGLQWQPWQHINKKIPVAVVEQKTDIAHIAAQKVETPIPLTLPPAQPVPVLETTLLDASEQKPNQSEDRSLAKIVEEQAASVLEFKDQIEPMNAVPLEQKPEIKPVEVPEKKIIEPPVAQPEKPKPAELKAIVKPEKSVLASANNFTLQLMVLSKQASVNSMLKKYPAMAAGVRTIKVLANGQEKFVLEYGAYPDAVSASKARQSLPAEFHNAMVKKQGAR